MSLIQSFDVVRKPATTPRGQFLSDVMAGLSGEPKTLPSKYFYDARGSELFERITATPEYYLTRREAVLITAHADEMMSGLDEDAAIIEFGADSSVKMLPVLANAPKGSAFIPIDVSGSALRASAKRLKVQAPNLVIHPWVADFADLKSLPEAASQSAIVAFFLGSTIGNFAPEEATALLSRWRRLLGRRARLIVGADLVKDPKVIERAYNDAAGVTEAFNLNILRRINRELEPAFDLSTFEHVAPFNDLESRIEMHLRSTRPQRMRLCGRELNFTKGETIHTENSYKHTSESLANIAHRAGWRPSRLWNDGWFMMQELQAL